MMASDRAGIIPLIVAAHDKDRTFILASDGQGIILSQPLARVIKQFVLDNDVNEDEMRLLHHLLGWDIRPMVTWRGITASFPPVAIQVLMLVTIWPTGWLIG